MRSTVANLSKGDGYVTNVKIGDPPQQVSLFVDLGSSDTWTISADFCKSGQCAANGAYDTAKSNTKVFKAKGFKAAYYDKSQITGDFYTDTISIDGKAATQVPFGVVTETKDQRGTLGLGYVRYQTAVIDGDSKGYPTLPSLLAQQGVIKVAAYSLWLDRTTNGGVLLFGGIDSSKFTGKLATLPVSFGKDTYSVNVGTASFQGGGSTQSVMSPGFNALLDSGARLSYLPPDFASQVWNAVGVKTDPFGYPFVKCDAANSPAGQKMGAEFVFRSTKIIVPMSELIVRVPPNVRGFGGLCYFGIAKSNPGETATLGIPFVRSAYIVHDMSNQEISIAQAKFTRASNVIELGPKGVRGLNLAADNEESQVDPLAENIGPDPLEQSDNPLETADEQSLEKVSTTAMSETSPDDLT